MKNFKKDFIFSTSTCAFQVEGGRKLDGREYSIWDRFTIDNYHIPKPGSPEREIASIEIASDFYHQYKKDVQIMHKMGVNAFVYNMDWARIFPNSIDKINEKGIKWYEDVFKELNKNGVKPIPILYHWDHPVWLEEKGGVDGDMFLQAFRNFAKIVFEKLGKYSDIWFVNDENSTYTVGSYLKNYNPPRRNDPKSFWKAVHNLNMSGAVCKEEFLKAKEEGFISKNAKLGIAHDWSPAIPYNQDDVDDQKACDIFNEYNLNLYLDPNLLGKYPKIFYDETKKLNLNVLKKDDLKYLKKFPLDLVGWNYYRPSIIANPKRMEENIDWFKSPDTFITNRAYIVFPKGENYTEWKWLIKPEELISGSKKLFERYGKELMIIENGIGYFDKQVNGVVNDKYRIDFLNNHLKMVQKAIEQGVPFIGYSLWTYCDIFSPSGGYRKKYGLVGVDFENSTLKRYGKSSFYWYKDVIDKKTTFDKIDYKKYHKEALDDKKNWQ